MVEILGVSILAFSLLMVLAIVLFLLLIVTLIHQAKRKKWVWFTTTLILTLIFGLGIPMIVIYWIYYGIWGKK